MIKLREEKNKYLIIFLKKYFKKLIKKNFQFVYLKNEDLFSELLKTSREKNTPIILCMNHSNWWDAPLLIYFAYSHFDIDGYCFMELKQLKKYPFFNLIGAIPIVRENVRSAVKSLNFGVEIVKNKSKVLAIFPQGELVKNSKLPIKIHSGIAYLVSCLGKCILVLSYIDYRFSLNRKPNIYIDIFKYYNFEDQSRYNRRELTRLIESDYLECYKDFEERFLKDEFQDFKIILEGKKSISEKEFPIRSKVDTSLFSD
ncbi:MAG: lysophospholipid acyltransferase family protein [Ignavibacteria bacterium]|nr:lysophospholipid acyltransferase family protein [Ignavibacteria bacterium]